jgi:hypothetical protein
MKGELYLAAVSMLVLILGSLEGVISSADDQIPASSIYSSKDSWWFGSEHTPYLLPAAQPYTEFALAEADLASGTTGVAIATCPSGSTVVGGGYAANMDVALYTQYKYENGWRGDATNNSFWTQTLSVYAVCLHNVSGASVTQVHGQVDVPSGLKGQAIATCPAGSIATGGGFFAYPDGSLRVYNSSKYNIGEAWQSWAENLSGSSKTLHAYAICLSGSGGEAASILKSAIVPPNGWAIVLPTCDRGWLTTSGGFAAQDYLVVVSNAGPFRGSEWWVGARNRHLSEDRTLHAYATCLSLPGLADHFVFLPLVARNSVP